MMETVILTGKVGRTVFKLIIQRWDVESIYWTYGICVRGRLYDARIRPWVLNKIES
jgi:hypothetical protein